MSDSSARCEVCEREFTPESDGLCCGRGSCERTLHEALDLLNLPRDRMLTDPQADAVWLLARALYRDATTREV